VQYKNLPPADRLPHWNTADDLKPGNLALVLSNSNRSGPPGREEVGEGANGRISSEPNNTPALLFIILPSNKTANRFEMFNFFWYLRHDLKMISKCSLVSDVRKVGIGWIRENFEIRPGYKVTKQELRYVGSQIHASQPNCQIATLQALKYDVPIE
jgi:hypothetical protein